MLSVAQMHHSDAQVPTSSKHTTLGQSWSSERPNTFKRRKVETNGEEEELTDQTVENLSECYTLNSQEITLTPISKSNNQKDYKELLHGKIKISPISPIDESEITIIEDNIVGKESDTVLTNFPAPVLSFLKNSSEVVITKRGSKQNINLISQNETSQTLSASVFPDDPPCSSENINGTLSPYKELSEVTIEPCTTRKSKTQPKLAKAAEFLKKQADAADQASISHTPVVTTEIRAEINSSENHFEPFDYVKENCPLLIEEQPEQHASSLSIFDYEPFSVGIPCDTYYGSHKDKPHYTVGFPNPPGENRCWTNATLQALFTLPVLNKLDSLDTTEFSKLMIALINVQVSWRRGNTASHRFDQTFSAFKEELSVLDELYSSKAQQDVSEFVMNLLNFIRNEFANILSKQSRENEIENTPNNVQDLLPKAQNNNDSNRRFPLADISASAKQTTNNPLAKYSSKSSEHSLKINPYATRLRSNDHRMRVTSNPIDEYFLLHMTENYVCDGCFKQRSQKIENLMLFIDLPTQDNETTNLIDMINSTYALEHRSIVCESCKHNMHSMESKLKKVPKILTVQVKRYQMTSNGMITKKNTQVEIPQFLELESLVINNDSQDFQNSPKYEPVCIISHIGDNIDSGHYISFVYHEEQWFCYDDMNVRLVTPDEVFKFAQTNAYVIFFRDVNLTPDDDAKIIGIHREEGSTR